MPSARGWAPPLVAAGRAQAWGKEVITKSQAGPQSTWPELYNQIKSTLINVVKTLITASYGDKIKLA